MPGAAYPPNLLEPIASSAGGSFITNPMPDAPPGGQAASVQQGFPPVTMENELAGGLPPNGQDMNGFLFLITSHTMYLQCGQAYQYNATLAADIGGYLAGSILGMLDGTGLWLNVVNGNSTDPDTGGAGWVPIAAYGNTTLVALTGGTVALTAAQAKYGVIILEGALTSNLIVEVPETLQEWLFINLTTGAHTTTVQTAAGGSMGTVIPQGGYTAPVGVYSIGDGNVYPLVAPLSVATSQNAVANTLAERTNTADLLANYFNGATALENPAVGAVIVQNTAADGNFRKISLANFLAQAFTNAALSGNPTAPTQAPGNNSTRIATTAFVAAAISPGSSLGGTGWRKNSDGTIEQWGNFAYSGAGSPVAFPLQTGAGKFTTAIFSMLFTTTTGGFTPGRNVAGETLTAGSAAMGGLGGTPQTIYWRALGK